jgi:hypothetical protein
MKSVIMRGIAIVVFGAAAAGLTAGTSNARPLEEINCSRIDQVIHTAQDVITSIFHGKNKKEQETRCEIN